MITLCNNKYVTFTSILGIFIPIPGLLLALLVPDWGYIVNQYPPFTCTSQNANFWYYTAILPLNILLAIGASLFVFIFWTIHKVREFNNSKYLYEDISVHIFLDISINVIYFVYLSATIVCNVYHYQHNVNYSA